MSTLKTHNLQSPDAASVNIALAPNNGMVVAGISTFNNRVLIGTNIEGHADADDLTIGSATNTAGITIRTNTAGTGRLFFSDGTSGAAESQGYVQYDHNNQRLSLGSGGSTRINISSTGDVGISSASPRAKLDVKDANTSLPVILRVSADNATPYALVIGNDDHNTDANNGLAMWVGGSKTHHIQARTSETASENKLEIEAYEITLQTGSSMNRNFYFDQGGRLLIGTSTEGTGSGDNLTIADSGNMGMTLRSTDSNYCNIYFSDAESGTGEYEGYVSYSHQNDSLEFATSHVERLKISSTGILVTGNSTAPNSTDVGSIFMPGGGDLGWLTSSGSITFNAYYNGGWKYVTSGTSHILWASSEGFNFSTASSGSADGTISYSRAMKIFTNNRVSIGDGNSGTPLGALHINTKSTMGTDTALWIGDNANKRYLAINQFSNSEQFSELKMQYNDNATRSILKLSNPYAPAGYGTAILWQGYNDGQQGMISCQSENANSAAATMYLNSSSGTFLKGNSNRHVTMPQQPSFAAYQSQSSWTVSGTMVFNSTRHNVGNHYNTSNGHFTAPVSGSYQFNFYSIYKGNHTSGWVSLYKNNARMIGGDIHFTFYDLGNNWDNVSFSQVLYLDANDYVEMKSAQSTTWHGNNWQCFSGYLLG